jgi:hypothetical protein
MVVRSDTEIKEMIAAVGEDKTFMEMLKKNG